MFFIWTQRSYIIKFFFLFIILWIIYYYYYFIAKKPQNYLIIRKQYIQIEKELNKKEAEALPWYIKGGLLQPIPGNISSQSLWPNEFDFNGNDRMYEQLMFIPQSNSNLNEYQERLISMNKSILLINWPSYWKVKDGNSAFDGCPVNNCDILLDTEMAFTADLIIFNHEYKQLNNIRNMDQIWMMQYSESPFHTPRIPDGVFFNWSSTYRTDSEIFYPYGKWIYYDSNIKQLPLDKNVNYAANKTKKVGWFVSNCEAKNDRLNYAKKLQKYIEVDIYGKCGTLSCPRNIQEKCFQLVASNYKFYLSFENSNCRDYITEKFFRIALQHDIIPIVMGAHPDDYIRAAPQNSYIHVDDFESPTELASFLNYLDLNDDAYNEYFKWKGTGQFIWPNYFCRVCALLHDPFAPRKENRDLNAWWTDKSICRKGSWRDS